MNKYFFFIYFIFYEAVCPTEDIFRNMETEYRWPVPRTENLSNFRALPILHRDSYIFLQSFAVIICSFFLERF